MADEAPGGQLALPSRAYPIFLRGLPAGRQLGPAERAMKAGKPRAHSLRTLGYFAAPGAAARAANQLSISSAVRGNPVLR
jgi:hypothetical protein